MLYRARKREMARKEVEAGGESLWTPGFSQTVRNKIWHAFRDATGGDQNALGRVALQARELLLRDEGLQYLVAEGWNAVADFEHYFRNGDDEAFASCVEAVVIVLPTVRPHGYTGLPDLFGSLVNDVFAVERVSFELVDGRMVPFASKELHAEVVVPALELLSGRPGFEAAESAYQQCLREISAGDPADAITDAGRALQETLLAVGCHGNALGPLLTSARKQGLFGAHDYPLVEVIKKAVDWVSADRSEMGDAHKAGALTREDAWLTAHVVAALIVRFAARTPRSGAT